MVYFLHTRPTAHLCSVNHCCAQPVWFKPGMNLSNLHLKNMVLSSDLST